MKNFAPCIKYAGLNKIAIPALVFILVAAGAAFATYDPSTEKATFSLTKGWNLYPMLGGETTGDNCKEGEIMLAYFYSPLSNKYVRVGDESKQILEDELKTLGTPGKQYHFPYGGWFYYATADCDVWITWENGGINPFMDIKKGWQFVNKFPYMQAYSITFKNCAVEKFNQWDNAAKKWKFSPSASGETLAGMWDSAEAGEVFAIKFASDCTFGYSIEEALPKPPALEQ